MSEISVVVFDVNETLSDLAPMADRFVEVGAPGPLARTWFAMLLRDGFAATAAGHSERFGTIASEILRTVLTGVSLDRSVDDAIEHVMAAFPNLPLHPDVPDGVRRLREAGMRLVTLTNGATAVAERLLGNAGLVNQFERLLSVEDAGTWKPARAAYDYAASVCAVEVTDLLLVASHPWDIDGASRAGLRTAWINRAAVPYPSYFSAPDLTATGIAHFAQQLDHP